MSVRESVAIVICLIALAACDEAGLDQPPSPPTFSAPTTPAPSASASPALGDLMLGAPPAIGYVEDHEYVAVDGSRSALPGRSGISGIVPWRDGFLVSDTSYFEGTLGLARLDQAGRVVKKWPSAGGPVAATDDRVAWTSVTVSEASNPGPSRVFVGEPGGHIWAQTVRPGIIVVHGFTGNRVVFSRWSGQGVFTTDLEHPPRRLTWWPDRLGPGAVSPDGRRMLGFVGRSVQVRELRTGRLLRRVQLPRSYVTGMAWEGSGHLLAVMSTDHRTAIVRIGMDGALELATPIRRVRDALDPPYVLGTQS